MVLEADHRLREPQVSSQASRTRCSAQPRLLPPTPKSPHAISRMKALIAVSLLFFACLAAHAQTDSGSQEKSTSQELREKLMEHTMQVLRENLPQFELNEDQQRQIDEYLREIDLQHAQDIHREGSATGGTGLYQAGESLNLNWNGDTLTRDCTYEPQSPPNSDELIAVRWSNAPFSLLCQNLANISGKPVKVARGDYPKVTMDSATLPIPEFTTHLLNTLQREYSLQVQVTDQSISLGPPENQGIPDPRPNTFSVAGEVRTPGTYALTDGMTIRDAIHRAGGLTEYSIGVRVQRGPHMLFRIRGQAIHDDGKPLDQRLHKDDRIFVERR